MPRNGLTVHMNFHHRKVFEDLELQQGVEVNFYLYEIECSSEKKKDEVNILVHVEVGMIESIIVCKVGCSNLTGGLVVNLGKREGFVCNLNKIII